MKFIPGTPLVHKIRYIYLRFITITSLVAISVCGLSSTQQSVFVGYRPSNSQCLWVIVHPTVSVSVFPWLIRYKILLLNFIVPKSYQLLLKLRFIFLAIGNLSRFWLSCLDPLVYLLSKTFKLFDFLKLLTSGVLKVIPGTCNAH